MIRRLALLCAMSALVACDPVVPKDDTGSVLPAEDLDGDGHDSTRDCDDEDPAVHPGADEVCNGVDDDCDGYVDADDPDIEGGETYHPDADGDGFGDASETTDSCEPISGYVTDSSDCDDGDAAVFPGAAELCNGVDDDCDDVVDEDDAEDAGTWYADADGDGYGDRGSGTVACEAPSGHVADSSDCDDDDAAVNPAATELCNGVDDDCDGEVDEDAAADAGTWYADGDGDGYGDEWETAVGCEARSGFVAQAGDCDDDVAAINPAATELCNGVDDDCDGTVDVGAADAATWYADADGDGYGDSGSSTVACETPSGHVASSTDCDDSLVEVNPGATEACNGIDDDCDGVTDEEGSAEGLTWYLDSDGDGYGDASTTTESCAQPSGYAADGTDCDDSDATVSPGEDEQCNGVDDDCDGDVDEDDAVDASTWYADIDGDGYGDASSGTAACSVPSGHVADSSDCDDSDATVSPDATEICDGVDNDCDGATDEDDAADATTWYADGDGDGYGDALVSAAACTAPSGMVADATDCDDGDVSVNPGESELCDGLDNDCDGTTDEADAADATTWYADSDGDGYGDASTFTTACTAPSGYVADATDCDDGSSAVNTAATESCNGVDDDCDGTVDEDDAADAGTWYADTDGDGYGDVTATFIACDAPSGYVADATDCFDGSASIHPGASETCNSYDDDCDGLVDDADSSVTGLTTWYLDGDGDGYGGATSTDACSQPSGYESSGGDCDDGDSSVNPDAVEMCDGVDNDCDSATDEDDASDASTWYEDADLDGYGDATSTTTACSEPSGWVSDPNDCDDDDDDINPGASEVCNGYDDDCDGTADSSSVCPCNVEYNDDHVYLFCTKASDWWDARTDCLAQDNYDLATIDDASEDDFVTKTGYGYSSSEWWWIGYTDYYASSSLEPDGGWEWIDGSSSTYTNWASSQPDDGWNDEDCAHIYNGGTWNDLDCDDYHWGSTSLYFVCESG